MIRDKQIKIYIISKFCKYIHKDLRTISAALVRKLKNKFLVDESVILYNGTYYGTIYTRKDDKYSVLIDNRRLIENVTYAELRRFDVITFDLIFNFILKATRETPFDIRFLRKNTLKTIYFDRFYQLKTSSVSKSILSKNIILKPDDKKKEEINLPIENQIKSKLIPDSKRYKFESQEPVIEPIVKDSQPLEISTFKMENFNLDAIGKLLPIEKVHLKDIDSVHATRVINSFSFIKKFINHKTKCNITIDKFVTALQEITYNSDCIRDIHSLLIDVILKEVKACGWSSYIRNIQDLLEKLPDNESTIEAKKKNDIGLKTWKINARAFLWDLHLKTQNKTVYLFYAMLSKKKNYEVEEAVRVRLNLLDFFIACYCRSQAYKAAILELEEDLQVHERIHHEIERSIRLNQEAKKSNNDATFQMQIKECEKRLLRDLKHVKLKMAYNPSRSDLGELDQSKFTFLDGEVYVYRNQEHFILNRKALELIISCYEPKNPKEDKTITNLEGIIEAIYL